MRHAPWVVPHFLMPHLDTRTFQLTISVKGDLSADCQEAVTNWIKKNTHMHFIVIEHGENARRHLHALLLFKDPRDSRKIKDNAYTRLVKPYHPDSIARYAVLVQVCPGNTWYTDYLQKEVDKEILSDTWDCQAALEYFPSEAVQETLMAKSASKNVACPAYDKHVQAWSESTFENTPEGSLMFLKHRMNVLKDMVPISDPRKRTEKARMYWEYRNGVISPTERELFLLKQLEEGPSYDTPSIRRGPESSAPPSI